MVDAKFDSPELFAPSMVHDSTTAARSPARVSPALLADGYKLQYFAPFCYSPRGISPLAHRSRQLRDAVKRSDPLTLAICAEGAATIAKLISPDLLDADAALIPVPAHQPESSVGPCTSSEAIAYALYRVGFGRSVWSTLYRRTAISKSAWARPSSRPDFLEHCDSLGLKSNEPPTHRLLLIDDFVTRGRTLLAAAAVLQLACPSARIQALALIRTEGMSSEIDAIASPVIGVIRYVVGDAFRSP